MPNEGMKISQLPAATEVLDSDVVAGVGGGVTRKFTFATIASYIQTKLTALFAAKQDKITAAGVLQGDGDGGVTAKTVDSTPTASSTNLVTSGGVKSALDAAGKVAAALGGVSLNTVTDSGLYTWVKAASSGVTNAPSSENAGMLVIHSSGDSCYQLCMAQDGHVYFRYRSSSTGNWVAWATVV